ncbi:MAG: VanZ family protein [Deltaproteobacteria bacterium]|nr:VanZ family protein [Deltaproteobacteria bacterium]
MRRSRYQLWIPCVLLYAFITFVSSIPGQDLAEIIVKPSIYFDKLVHFVLYAFLGMVVARALAFEECYQHLKKRWYLYFAVILPLVSLVDEIHQIYVPDRNMDYYDWFADIVGAVFGAVFYVIFVLRKEDAKSLAVLERRDIRGFGLILAMAYFVALLGLNIFDYKHGILKNFSHLVFVFILIEYGLLGLLTIRFLYLRRDRKFFMLRDWLFVVFFGVSFVCLYQISLYVLRNEFLELREVFWSLFSLFLGALGYYIDKQIERFRKKIVEDHLYKRKTWQRLYFFLPPIIIIGAISFMSAQSPKVLYETQIPLPTQVFPQRGALSIFKNYFILHAFQFFVLGLFYFRAINWETWWHKKSHRLWIWIFASLLIVFYSFFDEIHQSFTPGRVGDPYDVLTNIAGLVCSLMVYLLVYRKIKDTFFGEENGDHVSGTESLLDKS